MHYILLAVALNLAEKNIDLMKLSDLEKTSKVAQIDSNDKITEKINNNNQNNILENNLNDENLIVDSLPIGEEDKLSVPFIESDNFAELLPEDESKDAKNKIKSIEGTEEEGPKFLENIKNKLIKVKNEDLEVNNQEEPVLFENIKNKMAKPGNETPSKIVPNKIELTGTETIKETPEIKESEKKDAKKQTTLLEKIKNKIFSTNKETDLTKAEKDVSINSQEQGPFFRNIKRDKERNVIQTVVETNKKNIEEQKTTIKKDANSIFESELEQALKDKKSSKEKEILNKKTYEAENEIKYEDSEEYNNFLENKEIKELLKPELVSVPDIKPREKERSSYKTQEVPEELLKSRSFQNRHIPKIITISEQEENIEKVIKYGMLENFKAYMLDIRDPNLLLKNEFTLLTYATKNKQYKIMEYLISQGADLNKRDSKLETPLIIALKNNDFEAIKILVKANADLNMLDILKRTPLIYSIEKGYDNVSIYLIENGADVNITNGVNEGTLSMAIRLNRTKVKEKIIELLKKENDI